MLLCISRTARYEAALPCAENRMEARLGSEGRLSGEYRSIGYFTTPNLGWLQLIHLTSPGVDAAALHAFLNGFRDGGAEHSAAVCDYLSLRLNELNCHVAGGLAFH
jgi:hypothetical protein